MPPAIRPKTRKFLSRNRKPEHGYVFSWSVVFPGLSPCLLLVTLPDMWCRGVRGATTVKVNEREEILSSTRQLLALMIRRNGIKPQDIASAIFTTTPDIDAEFPALAARQLNWLDVPLMCSHEMKVPGGLPLCVRVLIHWNTEKAQDEIQHIYIREAERLRPDLTPLPAADWEELEEWINEQMG